MTAADVPAARTSWWYAGYLGILTAGALCLLAAVLTPDTVTEGGASLLPGRAWGLGLLGVLSLVAASPWVVRRAPRAAAGWCAAVAAALLLMPWGGLVAPGTGFGMRLPLLAAAAVLLALATGARLAAETDSASLTRLQSVTVAVLALALPVAAVAVVRPVQAALNSAESTVEPRWALDPVVPAGDVLVGSAQAETITGTPYGLVVSHPAATAEVDGRRPSVVSLVRATDLSGDSTSWSYSRLGAELIDPPVADDEHVYLLYRDRTAATVATLDDYTQVVVTLDAASGQVVSTQQVDGERAVLLDAYDGILVVGHSDRGYVTSFDVVVDGEVAWSDSAPDGLDSSSAPCQVQPSIVPGSGVLVVGACTDGAVMSLRDPQTGEHQWASPYREIDLHRNCPAKAHGESGVIVLATCHAPEDSANGVELRGIEPATGAELWRTPGVGGYHSDGDYPFYLLAASWSVAYHQALGVVAFAADTVTLIDPATGTVTAAVPVQLPQNAGRSLEIVVAGSAVVLSAPSSLHSWAKPFYWVL